MIEELKALAEKATPGPWHVHSGAMGVNPWIACSNGTKADGEYVRGSCILNMTAHKEREHDAALICLLRNNLPAILSALSAVPVMKEALEEVRQYHEGIGKYRFVSMPTMERGNAMYDAWQEVYAKLCQALAALEGK